MMSAPITVWRFITVNSSSVSGPGLFRIDSGIADLADVVQQGAHPHRAQLAAAEASSSPTATANSAIAWAWPPV